MTEPTWRMPTFTARDGLVTCDGCGEPMNSREWPVLAAHVDLHLGLAETRACRAWRRDQLERDPYYVEGSA